MRTRFTTMLKKSVYTGFNKNTYINPDAAATDFVIILMWANKIQTIWAGQECLIFIAYKTTSALHYAQVPERMQVIKELYGSSKNKNQNIIQ